MLPLFFKPCAIGIYWMIKIWYSISHMQWWLKIIKNHQGLHQGTRKSCLLANIMWLFQIYSTLRLQIQLFCGASEPKHHLGIFCQLSICLTFRPSVSLFIYHALLLLVLHAFHRILFIHTNTDIEKEIHMHTLDQKVLASYLRLMLSRAFTPE